MGRTKGFLHVCDACGDTGFTDETVNTENAINNCGWYQIYHKGVCCEVCESCRNTWDAWNRKFLKIVEDIQEE